MPDLPNIADFDWQRIPLGPFDSRLWWLLIALCAGLLLTVQAVETAIDGAWPHQRRPTRYVPRARIVQTSWGLVALLVIPGAALAIGHVALFLWLDDLAQPEGLTLGAVLVGVGWGLFLLFSLDILRLGQLLGNLGVIGPIALLALLIIGDILLLTAFLDIVPEWDVVREASESGLRDILPFVDDAE